MPQDLGQSSKAGPIAALLGAAILLSAYVAWHLPSGSPISHAGVVQTSGSISASRIKGGTREAATVLLADGTVVTAYVVSGGALSAGDRVRVLEQRALLGPSAFQVVAREAGQ